MEEDDEGLPLSSTPSTRRFVSSLWRLQSSPLLAATGMHQITRTAFSSPLPPRVERKDDDSPRNTPASKKMRVRHVVRLAAMHMFLYLFVIGYVIGGAFVFHSIEGKNENETHDNKTTIIQQLQYDLVRNLAQTSDENEIRDQLMNYLSDVHKQNVTMDNFISFSTGKIATKRWTFQSSVLFCFTILTTIGYGNVAPVTTACQIFTMVYGAIGIPLFLITIADIGRFFKTGIMYAIKRIFRTEIKKEGEQNMWREVLEVLLVIAILCGFIAAGSAVLPIWEDQLSYYQSVYFSYMSLTTIGLGDIVPRRMEYLIPTLVYITVGLWLTTALVEQLADVFRLVHYAGRQIKDVKQITVWLGGRRLSVGGLIQTVCRKVGMSDHLIGQINWDRTLEQALSGVNPPIVPIFPWHFADFVEKDPPLIDLSMDLEDIDQMCTGSFYCSQLASKGGASLAMPRKPSQTNLPGRRHSVDTTPLANGKAIKDGYLHT